MKIKKIICLVIAAALVLSVPVFAQAGNWEDMKDVSGHWAEDELRMAWEAGLIEGFGNGVLGPDEYISTAQMATILTRVLGAQRVQDASVLGIDPETWYFEAMGKALWLGIVDSSVTNFDGPMLRQDAMTMMAKAFSLIPAMPDRTLLDNFSDGSSVREENRDAMAALVEKGYVVGDNGSLLASSYMSRAHFVTVLYRVAKNYISSSEIYSVKEGGTVISGNAYLNSVNLKAPLWMDCSSTNVSLNGVKGTDLIIRSHSLNTFSLGYGTVLDTLVVDCGSIRLAPGYLGGVSLDTLRFAGSGTMSLTDNVIKNIQITGADQVITIAGRHDSLIISGTGAQITLAQSASIGEIVLAGSDNEVVLSKGVVVNNVSVSGSENSITAESSVSLGELTVTGDNNTLNINGTVSGAVAMGGSVNDLKLESSQDIASLVMTGSGSNANLKAPTVGSVEIPGSYHTFTLEGAALDSFKVTGESGKYIFAGDSHAAQIVIEGKNSTLTVDGTAEHISVTARNAVINGAGSADILELSGGAGNSVVELSVAELVDKGISQEEINRILNLVSCYYKGNYTLQWAQEHDYEDYEKEAWINAKGYSSKTEYLLWVNLSMQRVNFFKGSQGEWELFRSCIVGSGAPASPTPVGVYYTTYKLASGWTTGSYTCKPVVGFKVNTGYAFHSRLYYPNSPVLKDPSIGFPVSAGCIRMYDEDINYIYNNIPLNTTVVVY